MLDMDYKATRNMIIIDTFVDSDYDCAIVENEESLKPDRLAYSLNRSARRFGKFSVRAVTHNDTVYLFKIL